MNKTNFLTADVEMQTSALCLRLESLAVLLIGATGSLPRVNTSNHAPYFIQSRILRTLVDASHCASCIRLSLQAGSLWRNARVAKPQLALLAHSAARYFAAACALLPNSRPSKRACSQATYALNKCIIGSLKVK